MSFKLQHGRKLVTLFIAFSLSMFLFLIGLLAYNNKVFVGKINYYTLVSDAQGLSSLPPIFFRGFEIGRVKKFKLTEKNRIRVDFYIYEEYQDKIINYSVVSISTNPLSGEIKEFQLITPEGDKTTHGLIAQGEFIPDIKGPEGQAYLKSGKLTFEDGGIEGILAKTNDLLKVFIENKTTHKIDAIIGHTNGILEATQETILAYRPQNSSDGGKQILEILHKANDTMLNLLDTMKYVKETFEVIHSNRREFAPLIINTNKTLQKAQNTLEGINNNPLLKGGISKENQIHGVEMQH